MHSPNAVHRRRKSSVRLKCIGDPLHLTVAVDAGQNAAGFGEQFAGAVKAVLMFELGGGDSGDARLEREHVVVAGGLAVFAFDRDDDHQQTVIFHLKQPNAQVLANLAMDFASILSAEYGDVMLKAKTPEKVDQEPIGTGPFAFVNYQKDAAIRFKAKA